jgi:DNA invertase Pin-like site-specific DNA recombinase
LDICGLRSCLIADRDGVYDPGSANGRLLLGLKGAVSELELHTIHSRLTAGLLAKAERGELALTLPIGFIRDPSGVVTKDPDMAVQERLGLVFEMFLKFPHRVQGHALAQRSWSQLSTPRPTWRFVLGASQRPTRWEVGFDTQISPQFRRLCYIRQRIPALR